MHIGTISKASNTPIRHGPAIGQPGFIARGSARQTLFFGIAAPGGIACLVINNKKIYHELVHRLGGNTHEDACTKGSSWFAY